MTADKLGTIGVSLEADDDGRVTFSARSAADRSGFVFVLDGEAAAALGNLLAGSACAAASACDLGAPMVLPRASGAVLAARLTLTLPPPPAVPR